MKRQDKAANLHQSKSNLWNNLKGSTDGKVEDKVILLENWKCKEERVFFNVNKNESSSAAISICLITNYYALFFKLDNCVWKMNAYVT